MAAGGWLAGAIYDYAGFYAAAFAAGIAFNLVNTLVIATLVLRQNRVRSPRLARARLPLQARRGPGEGARLV